MASKNYYITYYNAIIEKNVTKAAHLKLLGIEEANHYSDELGDKNYGKIFKSENGEDFTDELLEKAKYHDFKMELLKEIKALSANYQLALYQAVLNKNVDKVIELIKFNLHKKLEYRALDEIQNLEFDEIFQDKFPDEVIYEVLGESIIIKLSENLSINDPEFHREFWLDIYNIDIEALNVREENLKQVLQHPLLNYCPNPNIGLNILDSLVSLTYSKDFIIYQELINGLYNILKKDHIFATALSAIALSYSLRINEKDQFSTILIADPLYKFDPNQKETLGAGFDEVNKRLLISNEEGIINFEYYIHEKFHYFFYMLYNNDLKPVKADNKEQLDLYHKAIKEVLLNVHDFIKREFGINLKINSNETSWELGEKLALFLFPEQIKKQDSLDKYVELLDENNFLYSQSFRNEDSTKTKNLFLTPREFSNQELLSKGFAFQISQLQ